MKFSVIYSVDCARETSIRQYLPTQRKLFQQTEGDEHADYTECWGGKKGKHRKLCALLNRKQFERFLDDTGLFPEEVETMGSLGAPGFGFALVPAVSFRSDDQEAIQSAYVTPIPDISPEWHNQDEERGERAWRRIRAAVIRQYSS